MTPSNSVNYRSSAECLVNFFVASHVEIRTLRSEVCRPDQANEVTVTVPGMLVGINY